MLLFFTFDSTVLAHLTRTSDIPVMTVKVNMQNFASLLVLVTPIQSISPEMKLSLLSKGCLLPNCCQAPSRFWRRAAWSGEPQLRLKPTRRHRKRLSGGKSAGATQQSFPLNSSNLLLVKNGE